MSEVRSTTINLTWADTEVSYEGTTILTLSGETVNGVTHKFRVRLAPSAIGNVAERLYKAVNDHQRTLDRVKQQLKGE